MATSRIVTATNNYISQAISESYRSRQRTMDEISRRRSHGMLGVVDAIDPVTGRQYKVENGANHYWIDHRGVIVGTQTYMRQNIDFSKLT